MCSDHGDVANRLELPLRRQRTPASGAAARTGARRVSVRRSLRDELLLILARQLELAIMSSLQVRKATPRDAAGIVRVLETVALERVHSAIDQAWSVEQEASYLESLSPRETFHVAVDELERIVGFQSLDLWSSAAVHGPRRSSRDSFLAGVAEVRRWPAVMECDASIRTQTAISKTRDSGTRDEHRCPSVLSRAGIH